MKNFKFYILIAWLGLFTLQCFSCSRNNKPTQVELTDNNTPSDSTTEKNTDKKNKEKKKLKVSKNFKITKHARCRMKCRGIDEGEIEEILQDGKINNKKSETKPKKGNCPTYAIEGVTRRDKQNLRVIISACENETKIVTVIDLGVKVDNCPGDCK